MASRIVTKIARAAGRNQALKVAMLETRTFVTATNPLLEKHTIKVPTMGDSITEGTIVEWVASVGQMVNEDDVVALVETDKVTVDIKAEATGVLTQQFGEVDDTIEVGSDLYEIDTEAEATVAASEAPAKSEAPTPAAEPAKAQPAVAAVATDSAKSEDTSHRTPSIKFLGKDGWARVLSATESAPVVYAIPADYGRPAFTEEEMEALVLGGANLVPDVKNYSSGAKFGY
mmetsp:Transcript_134791/g.200570  ORF Transcript_134791/g.200570 Transcript_134791/m.200570 type:complete len:230 (-) Transcript_134791:9-698(-)|eukprot:CAMPEP_0117015274 /NCGR_PEP_ID=MMETSP0472-20121206/12237_1 /TAXON_ID=693140 ORGANISM="Tiarina fusus, Strain LIS" /NCGR_SAMPLE_ID=MMETSP0472 /ASSEMBLY_ACC=CAM_ASM_000603 /LENGTH=229 /DNA_ID=CAMNT_0004719045 /DNA_START=142 /DNA_END=831 /DNA_ORIENTATION=-